MKPLYPMPPSWASHHPDRDEVQRWQLDSIRAARADGYKSILLQAPMGQGKTVAAAKLALESQANGERVVFLCHLITLVNQAVKQFREWGVNFQVEQGKRKAHREFGDRPFHVIGLKDSLRPARMESFLSRTGFSDMKIVAILDECHLSASKSFTAPVEGLKPVLTVGLTGTPTRLDGKPLVGDGTGWAPFEVLVCRYDFLTACRHGILTTPMFRECDLEIDLRKVKLTRQPHGKDYDPDQLRARINAQLHDICNIARMEMRDYGLHRCLFFAPDVGIARAVEEWYSSRDVGIKCRAVYGDLRDRDQVLRSYHNGDLEILVSCQMLDLGFDDPPTDGVILATPTKSPVKAMQQGGRGSRLYPGKTRYVVIGFKWDDGQEGPQSTLDLLLKGVPDEEVRRVARDLLLGPRRLNLVEAIDEADLERKKELEEQRRRRASLRVVGSETEVDYVSRTYEPLSLVPSSSLTLLVIRRLVDCGKSRQEAAVMDARAAARYLNFWEPRRFAGMASAKQVIRLTQGCDPGLALSVRRALDLTVKEAQSLIFRIKQEGGIRRVKASR